MLLTVKEPVPSESSVGLYNLSKILVYKVLTTVWEMMTVAKDL